MKHRQQLITCLLSMLLFGLSTACRKKAPVAAPPPPPEVLAPAPVKPNAPTVSEFVVEPGRIERGQSANLRWQVRDATQVEIDQGIGSVLASDRRTISPDASTTYTLKASGPGGPATAAATLNVTAPPPRIETRPVPLPTFSERLRKEVQDVYFDYDRHHIRSDAMAKLTNNAAALKAIFNDFPDTTVVLEGHCDERGSAEYNLGLAARRVSSAKDFLENLGLPAERMIAISYGKERPQCIDENEPCWQKNRRVHFAPGEIQMKVTTQLDTRR